MRSLAVIIFLLISFSARSQAFALKQQSVLQGCYVHRGDEGYQFLKSGEFFWFKGSGSDKELGSGRYNVSGDSIHLKFEAHPQFDLQLNESKPNPSGKCVIEVRAIRSNGTPLRGLNVGLRNSKIIQPTDRLGIAKIEIQDPLPDDEIQLKYKEYVIFTQSIKLKGFDHVFAMVVDDVKASRIGTQSFKFRRKWRSIRLGDVLKFKKVSTPKFLGLLR